MLGGGSQESAQGLFPFRGRRMPNALAKQDKERLKQLEATISGGMNTFLEVGFALTEIRDKKYYLDSHKTFKEYCESRWKLSTRHANRLMNSAEVYDNIKDMTGSTNETNWSGSTDTEGSKLPLPESESQTRPIANLEPEEQQEAWEKAVESAGGEQPTAKQVDAAAKVVKPRKPRKPRTKFVPPPIEPPPDAGDSWEPPTNLPKSVANALADTWHAECARLLSKIRTECKSAFSWSSWLDASVLEHLKSAEDCFLTAIPRRLCPDCQGEKTVNGKSCQTCRQGGYLASQVTE